MSNNREMDARTRGPLDTGGLRREYEAYQHQKCFVGHSYEAEWSQDIASACAKVLPTFNLEPWYAADHFKPTKTLQDKVVEMISNARYGIYDLSSWKDKHGEWHLPRNVFIELGIAITLNRPALLLRHTSNRKLSRPGWLQGVECLEFVGDVTLGTALVHHLPHWVGVQPDKDWLNLYCIFGRRECEFRRAHPRAERWTCETLRCQVADGLDRDHPDLEEDECVEIEGVFDAVFSRYDGLSFDYLHALSPVQGYEFLTCSVCQTVRSASLAVYRILPNTPSTMFVAIGMSIALETLFEYDIPKILLVKEESQLPSLLRGYDFVEAANSAQTSSKLKAHFQSVISKARETTVRRSMLPFEETIPRMPSANSEASWRNLHQRLAGVRKQIVAALLAFCDTHKGRYLSRTDIADNAEVASSLSSFLAGQISSFEDGTPLFVARDASYPTALEVEIDGETYSVLVLHSWIEEATGWKRDLAGANTFMLVFESMESRIPDAVLRSESLVRFALPHTFSTEYYGGGGEEEDEEQEGGE